MRKIVAYFKNKYYLAILLCSLLSLIPFIFFMINLAGTLVLAFEETVDLEKAEIIFTRNIASPIILYPFIFGLIIWITNGILSAYFLTINKVKKLYGYVTILFGGIGIHLIILLLYCYQDSRRKTKVAKDNTKLVINFFQGSTLINLGLVAPVVLLITTFSYQSMEKPTKAKPITFSLNPEKPNLIEIFSDGLDQYNLQAIEENSAFKDFSWFTHFQTTGHVTHFTVPTIYGDFQTWNPFALAEKYHLASENDHKDFVYSQGWLESGVEHLQTNQKYFTQRTIVNPTTFSNRTDMMASNSGTPQAISALDQNLNVVNWTAARNDLVNNWGISDLSPDGNSYSWVKQKSLVNERALSGSRVFLLDLITHRPFATGNEGKYSPWNFYNYQQLPNLQQQLASLFTSLKMMKNDDLSVYDNSLIIVYGDHSNHEVGSIDPHEKNKPFKHNESALMIKYPQQKQATINIIEDRYLYSPQVNSIINDYFKVLAKNNYQVDPLFGESYFANSIFDNLLRPVFTSYNQAKMVKWTENTLVQASEEVFKYQKGQEHYPFIDEVQYETGL